MISARHPSLANPPAVDVFLQDFYRWLLSADFTPADDKNNSWRGEISVEWKDPETGEWNSATHLVMIFLPAGFPYHAPVVLSRDGPPLHPSWHLSPEGALCLWREPGGWKPFMSPQKLLERVSDWFRYYHMGDWPKDFNPTDLHLYLQSEGTVVIGDEWVPIAGERRGDFTMWRNKEYSMIPTLVGVKNSFGKANQEERLRDQLGWIEKGVQSFHGVWYRVNTEFVPSNRLDHLLDQIDQSSGNSSGTAHSYMIEKLSRMISAGGIPLAIGYPTIRGLEQWLFLWIPKPNGKKIYLSRPELMKTIEVRSFETMPARKADLLRRTVHLSKDLGSKKVAVFGVGALGGSIALLLAKAGLGEIRLIDSDIVKPVNVIRHIAGLNDVGFAKTFCVRRNILRHNPDCNVMTFPETWQIQDIEKILHEVDLTIDTTANTAFSLYLNQFIIPKRGAIIFAAAYRRAAVGRLILNRGDYYPSDPCLACYQLNDVMWDENIYPLIPPDSTTTFEEEGCAAVTEEADAIHIEMIASQCASLAIKQLVGQMLPGNLYLLVNESIPEAMNILNKPGIHILNNSALPGCPICHHQRS